MEEEIKNHMREILWIHYLYDTGIFLSFELLEYISHSLSGKNLPIKNSLINTLFEETVQDCLNIKKEGIVFWVAEDNKYFKTLIRKDLTFLSQRDTNIEKKWFILPYSNFLPVLEKFRIKNKNKTFYDIAMELDTEYKKLVMLVYKKKLDLGEEIAQILNFYEKDFFMDDYLYYEDNEQDSDNEENIEVSEEVKKILNNIQDLTLTEDFTDEEYEE